MRVCAAPTVQKGFDLNLEFGGNLLTGASDFSKTFGQPTSLENDTLSVAATIFAVDLAARREQREDFVREMELVIHVANLQLFRRVQRELEYILWNLSNDNWTITFEHDGNPPEKPVKSDPGGGTTLLFSGGLDSFVVATELLNS